MPDSYESVRSLPFPAIASALGLDINRFKRKGNEWVGPCPVHGSQKNVNCFRYNDDGRFNCFSQGCKGRGAIDLTKLVRNTGFKEAISFLEGVKATPEMKSPAAVISDAPSGVLEPFTGKYHLHQAECEWLNQRVANKTVTDKYGVSFYHNPARNSNVNGHVLIPIKDIEGVQYGWLARNIGEVTPERPKYRIPANLPRNRFLFGAYELRQHLAGISSLPSSRYAHVFLVESPFACMHFASLNLPCVAAYGWSVSTEQIEILSRLAKAVVFLPDSNKRQEAASVLPRLAERIWIRFPQFAAEDPEYLSLEQIQAL